MFSTEKLGLIERIKNMKRFVGFEHGMGIGGWLTNYKRFNVLPVDRRLSITVGDQEHFESS